MKRKTNKDKGFTLVELIVVLVILAILAAILVPALLGYIDRAREKQYVLNAKSALTAAQAELSSLYGEDSTSFLQSRKLSVAKTADVPGTSFDIYTAKDMTTLTSSSTTNDRHAAYTVSGAVYKEAGKVLVYNGKSWVTYDGDTDAATAISELTGTKISIWTAYDKDAKTWTPAADTKPSSNP